MAYPDFDSMDALKLVTDLYSTTRSVQQARSNQYQRDYNMFRAFLDPSRIDPNGANIVIPKIFSIIATKVPRDSAALLATRPYVPFIARRKEFSMQSEVQAELLDEYLERAGFHNKMILALTLKTLYGTSFMEAIPYYETVTEKVLVPTRYGAQIAKQEVQRLRFCLNVLAPWELYVDPYAKNLEEKDGCRYVIKFMLTSKRQIKYLAQQGSYPGLDIERLDSANGGEKKTEHTGLQILSDFGLSSGNENNDDDIGVLMRYESPGRYIDVWNGTTELRDTAKLGGEGLFDHGGINLNRIVHQFDAHTQNQFWGIGEAKPNEILQAMLSDTYVMTFNAHNMINQPVIVYDPDAVNPDTLLYTAGARIPVKSQNERPLTDKFQVQQGYNLPKDHYIIPDRLERMMDMTSGNWSIQRGEDSGNEKTASEAAMLKEAGDQRQSMSVKLIEDIFLRSFAAKSLSSIEQFATMDDVIEVVGQEKAMILASANPQDLPGGFNYNFKGSDRARNQLIRQQTMKELTPLVFASPNTNQEKYLKMLYEEFEFNAMDISELVYPNQIAQMIEMGKMAMQQNMETQGKIEQQRFKQNTTKQISEKSARAHTGK